MKDANGLASDADVHLTCRWALNELTARLTHELSQPLFAVSNYAAACNAAVQQLPPGADPKLQEWTRKIAEQAEKAALVVEHWRNLLQRPALTLAVCDVNRVVSAAVERVVEEMETCHGRRVTIEPEFSPAVPAAVVDPRQMQRAVRELVRNAVEAVQACPASSPAVAVRTAVESGMVVITIADQGSGLPEELSDQKFDRFFSTKPGRIGLGLPICRAIVQSHQGRLSAASQPAGGAVFRIELPMRMGSSDDS